MNEDTELAVDDKQWEHAFDEVAGRVTPPDRVERILQRLAAAAEAAPAAAVKPLRGAPRTSHWWVAALVLLGFSATIGVAMLQRGRATGNGESTALQVAVVPTVVPSVAAAVPAPQEPAPKPSGPSGSNQPAPTTPQPVPAKPAVVEKAPAPSVAKPAAKPTLPKGTDPADLKAMRSAEAMLEAERKLTERIKAGKIAGIDEILTFDTLTSWRYQKGLDGIPENIRALDGKRVLMTGFMLPIDEVRDIKEFLLVKSLWSCCYGKPPDIHGIVRCVMPKGKTTDYLFDPLKVVGTFKVEAVLQDGYCVDIFHLNVEFLETIQ